MRNTLLTTTALLMSAGVAYADVTFSGKAEVGVSRTAKVKAVVAVAGRDTDALSAPVDDGTNVAAITAAATNDEVGYNAAGVLTVVKGTGTVATATINAAAVGAVPTADSKESTLAAIRVANEHLRAEELVLARLAITAVQNAVDEAINDVAEAKANVALLTAVYNNIAGTAAVAAVKAGDNVVYTGYDMNVTVDGASDGGTTFAAAFDMGAGSIADRDDDRVLDAQAGAIALSNVTIGSNGITYVIGQNKQDDLYDDTQNGDLSVSGNMGGIGFTLVTDFDTDTKAVAAAQTFTKESGTIGALTYKNATFVTTAAVAAVYESTSFKLSGDAGALGWSLTSTNKNDRGNAASKVVASYAAGDALSFTLTHDTQGKRESINTLAAKYTMDALTISLKAADDKNHAGNTNTSKKASQNMTIAYANGPWTASFNNDESSQWWSTTKYDLGGGADVFATVDHNEFAVLGMSFSF
jgi:hypothetical protein